MGVKEYLEQIHRIDMMVRNVNRDIERFKEMALSITVPMDKEKVQSSGTSDMVGNNVASYVSLQNREDVKEWLDRRQTIIDEIAEMPNALYYNVLYNHYVLDKSIIDIANTLDRSRDYINKVHKKALDEFENRHVGEFQKVV